MDLREWQIKEINRIHTIMLERAKVLEDFLNKTKNFKTDKCGCCGEIKNNIAYYMTMSFSDYKALMCLDCGYEDVKRMRMRPYMYNEKIKEDGENDE